mmetsp:Transcript_47015/g.124942  ORF Transcript_47015/g.124942 Transcript_47015/m.124942 type:complete len:224 (-) Transcript_47015:216-887(-)
MANCRKYMPSERERSSQVSVSDLPRAYQRQPKTWLSHTAMSKRPKILKIAPKSPDRNLSSHFSKTRARRISLSNIAARINLLSLKKRTTRANFGSNIWERRRLVQSQTTSTKSKNAQLVRRDLTTTQRRISKPSSVQNPVLRLRIKSNVQKQTSTHTSPRTPPSRFTSNAKKNGRRHISTINITRARHSQAVENQESGRMISGLFSSGSMTPKVLLVVWYCFR